LKYLEEYPKMILKKKIIGLFQEDDEITIIELDATYGSYMESIEALKEDIASYLGPKNRNKILLRVNRGGQNQTRPCQHIIFRRNSRRKDRGMS